MNEVDDFDSGWALALAVAPPVKAPTTRLLDMLVGWSQYAGRDEFPDSENAGPQIAELYQEAGQIASGQLTIEDAKSLLISFFQDRILPTLLTQ